MMTEKGIDRVREILAGATEGPRDAAEAVDRAAAHAAELRAAMPDAGDEEAAGLSDACPSTIDFGVVDPAVVARCASLPQSDTGNGERLREHHGNNLAVLETEGVASSDYAVWTGSHWDMASGNDAVKRVAQALGPLIVAEAEHLGYSPSERKLIADAEALRKAGPKHWGDGDAQTVEAAAKLPAFLAGRKKSRRDFGVTSGNVGRLRAMLETAAPHLTRSPEGFNADPMLVAVAGHTLRFSKTVERVREPDPECPCDESERFVERDVATAVVEAIPGHRREDYITKLLPASYDPAATCPRWDAFLAECLPDPEVRRCVQTFSGLGMTGVGLQRLLFHYGLGANGKSVFLETLMQILGPLGVGLPAASLVGENKASGNQANPDIVRLYGARIVRVAELPANEPVKEELVKLLTGGERMPARALFKGFFEFTPVFKAHLSGNGLPRIDGTDNGIWRRMVVVPWTVTIPEERRRELREVVAEFVAESSGILNWLIEGVLMFLREGFVVPEAALKATREYREEMDPIGQFISACVSESAGDKVQASRMYSSYQDWCAANAKTVQSMNKFSKEMLKQFDKSRSSVIYWMDCKLHDVPPPPIGSQGHAEER